MIYVMAKKTKEQIGKLQNALVLFKYILWLFGCKDLEALSQNLKDAALEGLEEDGYSTKFHTALRAHMYADHFTKEQLAQYDLNIVAHTKEINEKRAVDEQIKWKYYQYLSLLFTEIYLDKYFSNSGKLCEELNTFLVEDFNQRVETWHEVEPFKVEDLNKLAFWSATGSGKTLLMHINVKQYLYYARKHNAKKLNRIIILTPNEGLSNQHLDELATSNMTAELFSKKASDMFRGETIEIIDINKLADKDGDKTVAVDSFEGNNLVLVDEGHKGSSGKVWLDYREKLTSQGFSFEYSATFGQAISALSDKERKAKLSEYGKATLFDYSYRYFYRDGFGKDYRIMNMDDWNDDELLSMYLTAYLMCLYEQMLVYRSNPDVEQKFLIAKPLGIFVGGSVTAVCTDNKRKVSDVVQVLKFLQEFVAERTRFCTYVRRLLDPNDGVKDKDARSIFAHSFRMIKKGLKPEHEQEFAECLYSRILSELFHCNITGAHLHLDRQKGEDGEIGLRIGTSKHFGVINVGDSAELLKLCEEQGFECHTPDFGKMSLFEHINDSDSPVCLLIGSKKFTEGWSCWRVSAMGLMNIGRSEGSEIIQLFGRGVRLKGYCHSLKRSTELDACYQKENVPEGLTTIETLNIFGVRADYMADFKKYLEDEGLPTNDKDFEKFEFVTDKLLPERLRVIRLKDGYDFKKDVVLNEVRLLDMLKKVHVKLDWRPKVEALLSDKLRKAASAAVMDNPTHFERKHLALLDWNKIFFAIERMKNERTWYNMELSVSLLQTLMGMDNYYGIGPEWYDLLIPEEEMKFTDFGRNISTWEEIVIALLRGYIDQAYKKSKGHYESQYMEVVELTADDPNYISEYVVEVRRDQEAVIEKLRELKEKIESGNLEKDFMIEPKVFEALVFDRHLYKPLMYLLDKDKNGHRPYVDEETDEKLVKISPVPLNVGEHSFVRDLREYCNEQQEKALKGWNVYLLRNESRKGIGFFEANGFYPDFILWLSRGETQHVVFIDPKGIRNLKKGFQNEKIQLFKYLKETLAPTLNDPNLILDSYIISNTPQKEIDWWNNEPAKTCLDYHVLFQDQRGYVGRMIEKILQD